MKIIKSNESYSARMLRGLLPIAWAILIYLTLVAVALLLTLFVPFLKPYYWGVLLLSIIILIFAKKYANPFFDEVGNYRKGERGEKEVLEMLTILDDSYTYFENFMIPNARIGDIDGLLIGPKGIIILEIKNYQGTFRISGPDLYRRNKGDNYTLYRKSPFVQTLRQKKYLIKYFKNMGIDFAPVKAWVVFPEARISSINGETGIFVTENNKLVNHLFQLPSILNWNFEFESKIINSLNRGDSNKT